MTEQHRHAVSDRTPAHDRAGAPTPVTPVVVSRHRRSRTATLTAWLSELRRPDRRGLLIGSGVLVVLLLLSVGYVALIARDIGDPPPPVAAGSATPIAPTGPASSGAAPSAAGSPSPSPSAGPDRSPTPAPSSAAPRPGDGDRRESGKTSAPPRLVGPAGFDGFTGLLSEYCRDRGHRTAVLLEGPGYNPKTGSWACAEVTTLVKINLDDACRRVFGAESQARKTDRRDSRTWRCFDH